MRDRELVATTMTQTSDGGSGSDADEASETKEKLEAFKEDVDSRNAGLGFTMAPDGGGAQPGEDLSRGINADDTWTGPLAEEMRGFAKDEVDALASLFTGLSSGIQAEINGLG